jgi:hypothetical protein
MSAQTKSALVLFGYKEEEWSDYVLSMISPDEIDRQFGGNRIE